MVYCPKCGTKITKADKFCPNCGYKTLSKDKTSFGKGFSPKKKTIFAIIGVIVIILIGVIWFISYPNTENIPKLEAENLALSAYKYYVKDILLTVNTLEGDDDAVASLSANGINEFESEFDSWFFIDYSYKEGGDWIVKLKNTEESPFFHGLWWQLMKIRITKNKIIVFEDLKGLPYTLYRSKLEAENLALSTYKDYIKDKYLTDYGLSNTEIKELESEINSLLFIDYSYKEGGDWIVELKFKIEGSESDIQLPIKIRILKNKIIQFEDLTEHR